MDWTQLTTQIGQFIYHIFTDISKLVDQILISGVLYHLFEILKAIGKFVIVILEVIVRLLKFIVK